MAHKNPHLNILEVGAGTAGATIPILRALGGQDGTMARFANYDFTDISAGFFDSSRQKTIAWGNLISFKKLDIEADPIQQGYQEGSYDLVIAANVLHATRSMRNTMENVRKLFKPGGKLVLVELTHERITTSTIFGTLSGWWPGEEATRQKGPTLTEAEWHTLLQSTGFAGVQESIRDSPKGAIYQGSMMVASASSGIAAR
ncbi:polyketide synthase [Xylographa trunciseda]|nr:polyketide synthase [Xylographa trunciseda]